MTRKGSAEDAGADHLKSGFFEFEENVPNWSRIESQSAIKYEWNPHKLRWDKSYIVVKIAENPFSRGSLRVSYYCLDLTENVAQRTAARQLTVNLNVVGTSRSRHISPTESCPGVSGMPERVKLKANRSCTSLKGFQHQRSCPLPRDRNGVKLDFTKNEKALSPMSVPPEMICGRSRGGTGTESDHLPFPFLSPSVAGQCINDFYEILTSKNDPFFFFGFGGFQCFQCFIVLIVLVVLGSTEMEHEDEEIEKRLLETNPIPLDPGTDVVIPEMDRNEVGDEDEKSENAKTTPLSPQHIMDVVIGDGQCHEDKLQKHSIESQDNPDLITVSNTVNTMNTVNTETTNQEHTEQLTVTANATKTTLQKGDLVARLLGFEHRYGGTLIVAKKSIDLTESVQTYFNDARTQSVSQLFANEYNKYNPPKKVAFIKVCDLHLGGVEAMSEKCICEGGRGF